METGRTHTSTLLVEERHLANHVGSGDLPVLASPVMFMLMENASMKAVEDALPEGSTTVGGFLSANHLAPTVKGAVVSVTAELMKIEGRKLEFKVTAFDGGNAIGEGTHIRYIVDRERFMQKANGGK